MPLLVVLLLIGYVFGYRFDGLSAARANTYVPNDSVLIDVVEYDWGGVYILSSPENPVTAVSEKSLGILWSSRFSTYHTHQGAPVQTIGGISFSDYNKEASVISILVNDSNVAYIEAGPEDSRVREQAEIGEPITLSWENAVQIDRLYPKAFDKNGKLLYEYRYAKTNHIRLEDLKWYPIES